MNILDSLKKYFYKNGSSEASSDARIPLLDASGNPIGSDTMANIASVLGAFGDGRNLDSSQFDANTAGLGFYRGSNFLNTPTKGGILLCYKYPVTGVMYQVFCSYEGGAAVYSRAGIETKWSSWGRADGFGYSSLSGLANALGVTMEMFVWNQIPSGADVPINDNQLIVTLKMPNNDQNWGKISFGDDGRVYIKATNRLGAGSWIALH